MRIRWRFWSQNRPRITRGIQRESSTLTSPKIGAVRAGDSVADFWSFLRQFRAKSWSFNHARIAAGLTAPLLRSINRRRYKSLQRAFGVARSDSRVASAKTSFLGRFCLGARFPNKFDLDYAKQRIPKSPSKRRETDQICVL